MTETQLCRIDREGRDVTNSPGLWDESDLYECGCGFTWHQKHGEDCASCQNDDLRALLDAVADLTRPKRPS